jgi:hypothetical protein
MIFSASYFWEIIAGMKGLGSCQRKIFFHARRLRVEEKFFFATPFLITIITSLKFIVLLLCHSRLRGNDSSGRYTRATKKNVGWVSAA